MLEEEEEDDEVSDVGRRSPGAGEARRLAALRGLELLDTPSEERFDRITRIAAHTFGVPIALVTLVDHERQWFKACLGLETRQTSRTSSFCARAVESATTLVVTDALTDPRFAANPLVTGDPHIRFYAGHPVRAPTGELVGSLCVIDRVARTFGPAEIDALVDLAALVEAELRSQVFQQAVDALQEVDHLTLQFVSAASHELRSPLTSVLGYLEVLLTGAAGTLDDVQTGYLEVANRNALRLQHLVQDLLTVSRLQSGALHIVPATMEVDRAVENVVSDLAPEAAAKEVSVEVSGRKGATVVADPLRVEQMIRNLLGNAIKFSDDCGKVCVTIDVRGPIATITVDDDGPGVPADELERLGEPFFRASNVAAVEGTGLGLLITRQLAEAHGGSLVAHSELGFGATFVLELPAGSTRPDAPTT